MSKNPDAYMRCRRCKLIWNVSIYTKVPRRGYLCPECEKILSKRWNAIKGKKSKRRQL